MIVKISIGQKILLSDGTVDYSPKWKTTVNICTKTNLRESVYQLLINEGKKQKSLHEKVQKNDCIKLNLFR